MMTEKIPSATGMKELHDTLRMEMTTVKLHHKEHFDHDRNPDPTLERGDMVWFLRCKIHIIQTLKKLDWKLIGPFKLTTKIDSNVYKLDLSLSMRI